MTVQEYLKEKPLLFDGAMGTYLVEKHPETVKRNCEFMNIEHPEWVQKIHEKYLKAGAVAIKTNTFSANTVVLQQPVEKVKKRISDRSKCDQGFCRRAFYLCRYWSGSCQ